MPQRESSTSRRDFIKVAAGSASLLIGVDRSGRILSLLQRVERAGTFVPNQWIAIDTSGIVTVRCQKSEMGQGVRTSIPAIAAAELGADWSKVHVLHAEPGPSFTSMGTSGSGSIEDSWGPLRQAAAAARAMLVSAASNRWSVAPTECDTENGFVIHRASDRRLAFGDLVAGAAQLDVPKSPALRPDAELHLLGTALKRVDAPAIVRGIATYGIDVRVPNMRFAVIARPPVAGAQVARMNETAAHRVAGVQSVVRTPSGVAVVASTTWGAIRGRTALDVEWDRTGGAGENSSVYLQRLEDALPAARPARHEGDPAAAFSGAARHMTALYHAPFQAHAAMEPLNCVADVRADRCDVWVGTQRPNTIKSLAATMLGISEDRVTVHVTLLGGAFGRRIAIDYAREAIELSRAIVAPVQVVWTRDDDFAHDFYQAAQVNRMSAALNASGDVVGWRHEVADYHLTMFGDYDPKYNPAADGDPWGGFDTPYHFPALDVTMALLEAPVPTGAWRSVAYPPAVFARESFLDEVAHETGRDPLGLRLSFIPSPGNAGRARRPDGDRLR